MRPSSFNELDERWNLIKGVLTAYRGEDKDGEEG